MGSTAGSWASACWPSDPPVSPSALAGGAYPSGKGGGGGAGGSCQNIN